MATNPALDDALLEAGNHLAKEAAAIAALEEYIRHRKQFEILDLFGIIDFDSDYGAKQARQLDRI
jgi:hypothetical protein